MPVECIKERRSVTEAAQNWGGVRDRNPCGERFLRLGRDAAAATYTDAVTFVMIYARGIRRGAAYPGGVAMDGRGRAFTKNFRSDITFKPPKFCVTRQQQCNDNS